MKKREKGGWDDVQMRMIESKQRKRNMTRCKIVKYIMQTAIFKSLIRKI